MDKRYEVPAVLNPFGVSPAKTRYKAEDFADRLHAASAGSDAEEVLPKLILEAIAASEAVGLGGGTVVRKDSGLSEKETLYFFGCLNRSLATSIYFDDDSICHIEVTEKDGSSWTFFSWLIAPWATSDVVLFFKEPIAEEGLKKLVDWCEPLCHEVSTHPITKETEVRLRFRNDVAAYKAESHIRDAGFGATQFRIKTMRRLA